MKPITLKDPIWSEFHRLMRSHNLNESELLELLMKEHEKPKEEKPMQKEDPEKEFNETTTEMKNIRLDEQIAKLSELKELLVSVKELIKQTATKVEISNNFTEIKKSLIDTTLQLKGLEDQVKALKASQDSMKTTLSVMNDKLLQQSVMKTKLDTILTELTKSKQPPLLEPDIINTLTKLQAQWGRVDLSETVKVLISSYYNQK